MKKLFILLVLPIMALMFAACDDDKNDNDATTKLIKEISFSYGYKLGYEYDSQKRIIKITDKDQTIVTTTTVTYNKNDITLLDSDEDKIVYTLNGQGYVTKMEGFTKDIVEASHSADFTYENGNIKTISGSESEVLTFVWSNGNLTKVTGADDFVVAEYKYSDKLDKFNLDVFDNIGLLLPLKGFGIQNLKSEMTSAGDVYTYTYKLDADGYATEITETYLEDSFVATITYY